MKNRTVLVIVAVLNIATIVACVLIALDANKHRATSQPFLDTWEHHAHPASAPKGSK